MRQEANIKKPKSAFSLQPSAFSVGILLCLLAFGLRIYHLNAQSLWYDETFTAYHARQGLVAGVMGLLREDNTLPLHGALLALWIKVAGSGEFALRYFSVLIGTIAAPLALRLGRALTGRRTAGWGPALAIATLPIQVYYAQEVRMYALTVPLAVAFAWAGWRLARRGSGAIAYIALGVAMLLAHLYTGLLWAAIFFWGCLRRLVEQRRLYVRSWLWANFLMGIFALPIAAWGLWRVRVDATAASAIPLDVLQWLPVQFGVGQYLPAAWSIFFISIAAFSIIVAIVELIRTHRSDAVLWISFTLIAPVALLLAISHIKAKWDARYLLPSLGLALTVGAGLGWEMLARRRAWLGVAVALVWVGLALPAVARQAQGTWALGIVDEWHPRPDFRGAAGYIAAHDEPGDAIVVVGGYAAHTLAFYYDGPAHLFGLPLNIRVADMSHPLDLRALDDMEQEAGNVQRVWLVLWQAHLADPTNLVQSMLVEQCQRLPVSEQFTNVGLLLFNVNTCRPLNRLTKPHYPLEATFTAPIRLTGYDLRQTGETWELDLWWEATGQIKTDYTVFTHLVRADGTLVAQHDHIAGSDLYPTEKWTPGTRLRDRFFFQVPGGQCLACVIQVGLYNQTGRLPLNTGKDMVEIAVPMGTSPGNGAH